MISSERSRRSRSLSIALVAPVARPVRSDSTSSIEKLVSLLADEFVRRGHDVTLFATGDSMTRARLEAVYERGYTVDGSLWDNWEFHETCNVAAAFESSHGFDLIHSHNYHYALPFAGLVDTPVINTDHINPEPDILRMFGRHPEVHVAAVSHYQRRKYQGIPKVRVIYNGIDFASFPFNPQRRSGHLLFLGHVIPRKGVVEGINAARRAGVPLLIAGKADRDYYDGEVAPLVDGNHVRFLGPVGIDGRNELLAEAGALLFPSVFAEPFGLVLLESMACGTPVAALDRCAVREIVEPGITGHYAHDVEGLAEVIPATLELDRRVVRRAAKERFDIARMVDAYEALYENVANHRARLAGA